jgi:dipeptidyl aminopeptidase/acylaminoacyl peptidase
VRSKVHEYGGGAFMVADGVAWFSNQPDGRLYRVESGSEPKPVTTEDNRQRYADFVIDAPRRRLVAVREDHSKGRHYPENTIAAIAFDGSETVLVDGNDFYAAPRLSPDGRQLAWLCWDHPRMPWEGSELWLADVLEDGSLVNGRLVAYGQAVDLVYRRALVNDLVARPDDTRVLVQAYRDRLACVANTFRCKIPHKKSFFAVLTDEAHAARFSADEHAVIRAHVPWTRVVAERRTSGPRRAKAGTLRISSVVEPGRRHSRPASE